MFQPYSLLEIAAMSFVEAGYSIAKLNIPEIVVQVQNSAICCFHDRYRHFISLPGRSIVFRNNRVDLIESILNAGSDCELFLEKISNPNIGTMESANDIVRACDAINTTKRSDPRFSAALVFPLFAVRASFMNRDSSTR